MKAVINSNSLIEISKLIKADEFSVVVKDEEVKIIGTNTYENESYIEQVVIKENSYGNEKNGYKTIPRNVIQLFPKNTTLIIDDDYIKSEDQEIKLEYEAEESNEIKFQSKKNAIISNFGEMTEGKYAVSRAETRPVLKCMYINKSDIVALDGYRMSVRSYNNQVKNDSIIIPSFIVDKFNKFNKKNDSIIIPSFIVDKFNKFNKKDVAFIFENDDYVRCCFGNINIVCSRHVGVDFIDYNALLPKESKIEVTIEPSEVVSICNKILKFGLDSKLIRMNFKKNKSEISFKTYDVEFKKSFKSNLQGEEIEMAFNPKYIVDALKNYKGQAILKIVDEISPMLITDGDKKKDLVLPIRLMR